MERCQVEKIVIKFRFQRDCWLLYSHLFAWAAVTKYHRLHGLNNRNLFSHRSGGWKSKIKVLSGLVSCETSLPGL